MIVSLAAAASADTTTVFVEFTTLGVLVSVTELVSVIEVVEVLDDNEGVVDIDRVTLTAATDVTRSVDVAEVTVVTEIVVSATTAVEEASVASGRNSREEVESSLAAVPETTPVVSVTISTVDFEEARISVASIADAEAAVLPREIILVSKVSTPTVAAPDAPVPPPVSLVEVGTSAPETLVFIQDGVLRGTVSSEVAVTAGSAVVSPLKNVDTGAMVDTVAPVAFCSCWKGRCCRPRPR